MLPSAAGTWIAYEQQLTVNCVPVSAFCGRPPSPGGLNLGSCHVPVHATGSIGALAWVSLYDTIVRLGVLLPSTLGSHRVFQNTSLPEKKARFTPASRAASTLARWLGDQYSSWPDD